MGQMFPDEKKRSTHESKDACVCVCVCVCVRAQMKVFRVKGGMGGLSGVLGGNLL